MDREQARAYIARAEKALKAEFADEADVQPGRATFSANNVSLKFEVIPKAEDGSAGLTREEAAYAINAKYLGLAHTKVGDQFTNIEGEAFTITGWASRSPKYPVLARNNRTGKGYKFAIAAIQRFLPAPAQVE